MACKETTSFRYEDPKCIKVVSKVDENSALVGDLAETDANLEQCCDWANENSDADLKASTCPEPPEIPETPCKRTTPHTCTCDGKKFPLFIDGDSVQMLTKKFSNEEI